MRFLMILISLLLASTSFAAQPKEWTFLLFLNGNNNLDSYGPINLNQLEKIGSTDKINIVVQWASLKNKKVQRLLIQKDADEKVVTSPILQDLGTVDMGDWHSLVDFVKWGSQNFPAQHYFVDIWDHGSGWHSLTGEPPAFKDISNDDTTGHAITTKQLAQALTESSKALGQKIDLYASDACLMAMMEIASEVADSVGIYAGSEELEPGKGWPYDKIFERWNALPDGGTAAEVGKILAEEYAASYEKDAKVASTPKSTKVTFSAVDLNQMDTLQQSIHSLSTALKGLDDSDTKKLKAVVKKSQHFYDVDYVDFMDFITNLKAASFSRVDPKIFSDIETTANSFIVSNHTVGYPNANGMSLWIPARAKTYSDYSAEYSKLVFEKQTRWGDVAKLIAE